VTSPDAKQGWRFPRGDAALPAPLMDEIQRARIFEATCLAVAEEGGFGKTSVADILERAGMSNKTFYDYFDNKEHCLLAAYEAYAAGLATALDTAWSAAEGWREGLCAAIAAALSFGAEAPLQLRFLLVDAQTAGSALIAAQREAGERLAEVLRVARVADERSPAPSLGVEEMIVAGVGWRVGRALLDAEPLEPLGPELFELALAPYSGSGQAQP
jgi:AcrR family transcriptional regulator